MKRLLTCHNLMSVLIVLAVIWAAAYLTGCTALHREVQIEMKVVVDADSIAREIALDHYLSGSVHEEAGELHQAAVEYQIALLYDPESAAISVTLADIYLRLGRHKAAILLLESAREDNPENEELLTRLVELYLRAGRLLDAADCLEALAVVRPLDSSELTRLADILASHRRMDEALDLYGEHLARFGPELIVYKKIARIHLIRHDNEATDTTFKRIVELDSTEHEALFILGSFAVSRDEWDVAESYFRSALALDSSQILYWSNLLLTLNRRHKTEQALEVVDAAIDRFPERPQFYDILCNILEQLGRNSEALQAIGESIALDSTRLSPFLTKGYIHHTCGEWDAGAEAYERALTINHDSPVVLNNYAYMLSEQNFRLEDALEMVERALAIEPDSPSFLDTRGWILYRLGRYDEALAMVRRALKGEADNAELYEHMGYIYQALGKTSRAKATWRRAAELDPDNEEYARLAR